MPSLFQKFINPSKKKLKTFDPNSAGYDDATFNDSGLKRDPINNHASSLDPRTGMVLKGRNHPTFGWTINAEAEMGNTIVKAKDGRYYSRSKGQKLEEGDEPIKLTGQEQQKAKDAAATKIKEQSPLQAFGQPSAMNSYGIKPLMATATMDKVKYPEDKPDAGTLDYFKKNPTVAGMAIGGGLNGYDGDRRVVVNPYSGLNPEQRKGLIENERLRHFMDETKPELGFSPTSKQIKLFEGTEYGKPENVNKLKETIVARILTGDASAGDVTPEQKKVADSIRQQWEKQSKPKTMVDMVSDAIKMRPAYRR
jgi:hypothetical protein